MFRVIPLLLSMRTPMGGGTRNCLKGTIAQTLTSSLDCDFTSVLTGFRVVMTRWTVPKTASEYGR